MSSARASLENQCPKYSQLGTSHLKIESLYFIKIDAPAGSGCVVSFCVSSFLFFLHVEF